MQRYRLAIFFSGADLCLMLTSFYVGGPLHLRVPIFVLTSARQHREHGMAGTITPICLCDEPLLIRASYATYRAYLARAGWGQNGGGVAHSAEYILGGVPTTGTYSWRLKGRALKVGQRVERKFSRILGALWPQSLYLRTDLVCPTSGLSKVQ